MPPTSQNKNQVEGQTNRPTQIWTMHKIEASLRQKRSRDPNAEAAFVKANPVCRRCGPDGTVCRPTTRGTPLRCKACVEKRHAFCPRVDEYLVHRVAEEIQMPFEEVFNVYLNQVVAHRQKFWNDKRPDSTPKETSRPTSAGGQAEKSSAVTPTASIIIRGSSVVSKPATPKPTARPSTAVPTSSVIHEVDSDSESDDAHGAATSSTQIKKPQTKKTKAADGLQSRRSPSSSISDSEDSGKENLEEKCRDLMKTNDELQKTVDGLLRAVKEQEGKAREAVNTCKHFMKGCLEVCASLAMCHFKLTSAIHALEQELDEKDHRHLDPAVAENINLVKVQEAAQAMSTIMGKFTAQFPSQGLVDISLDPDAFSSQMKRSSVKRVAFVEHVEGADAERQRSTKKAKKDHRS